MAGAPLHVQQRMSVGQFRQFIEGRPDKERWELIDGVAMMMAPPTLAHQRIASNLERLLLDVLETHAPARTAFQAIGVNVGPAIEDYDPEPDVVVTDSSVEEAQDERYAERFYLAAEIVSSNERVDIDRKRSIYKLHDACSCILTVHRIASRSRSISVPRMVGANRCSRKRTISSQSPRSACVAVSPTSIGARRWYRAGPVRTERYRRKTAFTLRRRANSGQANDLRSAAPRGRTYGRAHHHGRMAAASARADRAHLAASR